MQERQRPEDEDGDVGVVNGIPAQPSREQWSKRSGEKQEGQKNQENESNAEGYVKVYFLFGNNVKLRSCKNRI